MVDVVGTLTTKNKMENNIHDVFYDEWKRCWIAYLNAFDERMKIDGICLKDLQVYEQIGCNEHNTNLHVIFTNSGTTVFGNLIDIDDAENECSCRNAIAYYMKKLDGKCDKITVNLYHSCYDICMDWYGFRYEIGFDNMLDYNEPYFAYCYKWLLSLTIYDDCRENSNIKMPTNIEKILYDDYLLKKLIQF